MEKETGLTIREVALTPGEVVAGATIQATLLMDIVEKTKCYQQIHDKKYLQVEAWETIGAFNRTHAETESMTPIMREGEIIGYQAHVQLWKDGNVVGGAIMPCFFTENACKGKEGDAKHKASMSAAQTFATSKAYRMNFSYVAILAGYAATPAEEMTGEDSTVPDYNKHWCKEHGVAFFKRGNMKGYAHKIGDTGEWCNEPTVPKPTPQPVQSTPVASSEDLSSLVFPDAGKLKTFLKDELGMNLNQIASATAGSILTTEQGLKDCWASILKTRET